MIEALVEVFVDVLTESKLGLAILVALVALVLVGVGIYYISQPAEPTSDDLIKTSYYYGEHIFQIVGRGV